MNLSQGKLFLILKQSIGQLKLANNEGDFVGVARVALELIATCLLYSIIVILVDFVLILVFQRDLSQIVYILSFVSFAEGGGSLTIGGVIASFSSNLGKISETIFRSKPWDAKRLKEAERTARVWIITGLILFLFGLMISAL
jgi:hypothetical protein